MTDAHRRSRFENREPPGKFSPSSKDLDWEYAATFVLLRALDTADWSPETGKVGVCIDPYDPNGPKVVTCTSLNDLKLVLHDLAQAAWDEKVPFDDGGRLFEMGSLLDDLLSEYHIKLEVMEWIRR
jgi:hypothetical protein